MRVIKVKKSGRSGTGYRQSNRQSESAASDAVPHRDAYEIEIEDLSGKSPPKSKLVDGMPIGEESDRKSTRGNRNTGNRSTETAAALEIGSESNDAEPRARKKASQRIEKGSFQDVYNRGVYLLSMREHSEQELATKLKQKFQGSDHIQGVIEQLLEAGYLSDERFVESYIRMRRSRGFGPVKVRAELNAKGIKNNLLDEYLDAKSVLWLEQAELAYEKKYGTEAIRDYQGWVKRARFMQSRGYNREHIDAVVPRVDFNL